MKKYFKKSLIILLWTLASLLALVLLLALLLQIPSVQNKIKEQAVAYIEGKIHTKITIEKLNVTFPKKIVLEKIYLESQQKDTLFYSKKLELDLSLFKLVRKEVEINSIVFNGITANIKRNKDSVFNFDYILKAFASKEQPTANAKPMTVSVKEIKLGEIKVKFQDAITKNDLNASFTLFETQIEKFDLENMAFEIPKIKLEGLKLLLKQGKHAKKITAKPIATANSLAKNTNLKIKLGQIALSKIALSYDNLETQLSTGLKLDSALIWVNTFDLNNQSIDLEKLNIKALKGNLVLGKLQNYSPIKTSNPETNTSKNNWKFKLNQANLSQIAFRFDDQNGLQQKTGIDYRHLDLKNINLDGEKLSYTSNAISGKLNALSVQDKSGLQIQSLKTEFYYGQKLAYLKKLYLKTPQTLLRDQIIVNYPSIATLQKNSGLLGINATLIGSQIGFKDILIFAPDLAKTNPFQSNPNAIIKINGSVSGKTNNIHIPNLEISGIGTTKIAFSGNISGLPAVKKAYFNLNIKKFESSAKDIKQFVPKGTLPKTIQLPALLAAKGIFKGTIAHFLTNMSLTSSFGNAKIKGNFNQETKNNELYDADAELDNFDLGKLISNSELGKVSLKAKIKGIGFNPKTASSTVYGTVISANYNKYTYHNGNLNGTIKNGSFNATLAMKDPNLAFDLVTSGSFKDKYPALKLKMNVDIADLEQLNLHAGPLKLKGQMEADFPTANLDYLNGTLNLHHLKIATLKGELTLDTINLIATAAPEKNTIALRSEFLDATISGKYQWSKVTDAMSKSLSKYYDTNSASKKIKTEPQQLEFTLKAKNSPVLFQLIPGLKSMEPISISGRYNSVNDTLVLNGAFPKLDYNEITITNALFKVDTQNDALAYHLEVNDIQNAQFKLPYTNLSGTVQNNSVDYTLQLKDAQNKEHYLISGSLKSTDGSTEVKLNDNLVLNYEAWKINAENRIIFGKNGLHADAFVLSKDENTITMQSESQKTNAPLAVTFKDFKIETLTNMVQKENLTFGGKINGKALIKNQNKKPLFTADLQIADFSYQKDTIGTLKVEVNNEIANTYKASVSITGHDNLASLEGTYRSDDNRWNLALDLQKLNLKSVEGFTMGNLTESSGFLSGNFKINGTPQAPKIIGNLQFNAIAFRIKQLNSYFKSMNDKVAINDRGLLFDAFTVSDEENNVLVLEGTMATTNFKDFGFNLSVNADNFKALNSKEKDNELYYGTLYLDSHLQIKGNLNQPIIEGNIKINKNTKLTVVTPQSDPSIVDREGIVEFLDQDHPEINKTVSLTDSIAKTKFKGFDASVNIEVDKEAELSLIIDKSNGDYLKLKGEARLNGGIDPSGKTTLTGRYEFTEGTYEMTFNLIKRKFNIKAGSYILWTGEPTTADINITAVYKNEAAPIDLLGEQLGNLSPEQRNTYKQKIPFETELIMKGDLMKPEITFDIVLPEGNNNVSTEIINSTRTKLTQLRQQPSELNKQVFALLLLNRFIGENPLASESGGATAEALARQSASKILSQQLNNLTGDLIQGVDLKFDLESSESYTSGQRENKTDLSVDLSKKLLNDRLKVSVSSTFGLEGQQQANQETNTIADNISAEYQLSKDGRYRLRAYRKNQYQVALQGQVIETGVAFVITMNYDKFNELFRQVKKEASVLKKEKPVPTKK